MMKLEIKNLQSSKTLLVDANGVTFGREGGDADVKLPDVGLSKKHAKLYARRGAWFLEDLNSVAGTFLNSQRISEPMAIMPGAVFTLSRTQFEVLRMVEEEDEPTNVPTSRGSGGAPEDAEGFFSPKTPMEATNPMRSGPKSRRMPALTLTEVPRTATALEQPLPHVSSGELDAVGADESTRLDEPVPRDILPALSAPPVLNDEPEDATETAGNLASLREPRGDTLTGQSPDARALAAALPSTEYHRDRSAPPVDPEPSQEEPAGELNEPEDEPRSSTRPDSQRALGYSGGPSGMGQSLGTNSSLQPLRMEDFLGTLPKALRFYVKVVPRLVIHPMTIIRRAIAAQPVQGMTPMELFAYALPANLFAALVGFLCAFVAQLVRGTVSLGAILPVGPLIAAVVASVISALVLHPVVKWVVDRLQGQSSSRSRSNFYAMLHAGVALTAIPGGLALLLGLIPLRFLNLLPVAMTLLASLITTYIAYSWFRAFGVVRWFQNLLLMLGVMGCVAAGVSQVLTLTAGLHMQPGSEIASATPADSTPGPTSRHKPAPSEAAATPAPAEEMEAATNTAKPAEPKSVESARAEATPPAPAAKVPPARAVVPAAATAKPPGTVVAMATAPTGRTPLTYSEFRARRERIEKAISDDPTLLKRMDGVLPLYERIHRAIYEIDARYSASARKQHPSMADVNARLKEADVYEQTADLVSRLHARLFEGAPAEPPPRAEPAAASPASESATQPRNKRGTR